MPGVAMLVCPSHFCRRLQNYIWLCSKTCLAAVLTKFVPLARGKLHEHFSSSAIFPAQRQDMFCFNHAFAFFTSNDNMN